MGDKRISKRQRAEGRLPRHRKDEPSRFKGRERDRRRPDADSDA